MKPRVSSASQKSKVDSLKSDFTELGIPEEWVEPLQELGYDSVDKLKAEEKPGRLHQKMMVFRKKNKLEIGTVTVEQVSEWISG